MVLKRKLAALGYPENECANIGNNDQELRKAVVWLERNKIKNCKPDLLNQLSNINSGDWDKSFEKYKQELACPVGITSREGVLDWIAGCALKSEYASQKNKYNMLAVENLKTSNTPNVIADNPLDHLDFSSRGFADGIRNLARLLKVCPHPDNTVTLEACRKVIQQRLHPQAVANPKDYILKGNPFPFHSADLGFDLGDVALNHAAKVLRLLYIHDLRNLQTNANEVIVAVQNVTANPKTDTKLGKVGR